MTVENLLIFISDEELDRLQSSKKIEVKEAVQEEIRHRRVAKSSARGFAGLADAQTEIRRRRKERTKRNS